MNPTSGEFGDSMDVKKDKQIVLIYYPSRNYNNTRVLCHRVSIDSLMSAPDKMIEQSFSELPGHRCLFPGSIFTVCSRDDERPFLYIFGGMKKDEFSNMVNRYVTQQLPSPLPEKCSPMIYGMADSLVAQVGGDIYIIGFRAEKYDACDKLFVQKYDLGTDVWLPVHHDGDIVNEFVFDEFSQDEIQSAPHVVIDSKLHVSFGKMSFAYDTSNHAWGYSNLFDTFWNTNNNHSPSNFYGGRVCGPLEHDYSQVNVPGQPFGFYGRGILWNNDILLGVYYAPNCALVAFKLENGIVVNSQRFTLKEIGLKPSNDRWGLYGKNSLNLGARLVDLGRGGHFCLVHFVSKPPGMFLSDDFCMEFVTFKVSRANQASGDRFVECQCLRKDYVDGNQFPAGIYHIYDVFSI